MDITMTKTGNIEDESEKENNKDVPCLSSRALNEGQNSIPFRSFSWILFDSETKKIKSYSTDTLNVILNCNMSSVTASHHDLQESAKVHDAAIYSPNLDIKNTLISDPSLPTSSLLSDSIIKKLVLDDHNDSFLLGHSIEHFIKSHSLYNYSHYIQLKPMSLSQSKYMTASSTLSAGSPTNHAITTSLSSYPSGVWIQVYISPCSSFESLTLNSSSGHPSSTNDPEIKLNKLEKKKDVIVIFKDITHMKILSHISSPLPTWDQQLINPDLKIALLYHKLKESNFNSMSNHEVYNDSDTLESSLLAKTNVTSSIDSSLIPSSSHSKKSLSSPYNPCHDQMKTVISLTNFGLIDHVYPSTFLGFDLCQLNCASIFSFVHPNDIPLLCKILKYSTNKMYCKTQVRWKVSEVFKDAIRKNPINSLLHEKMQEQKRSDLANEDFKSIPFSVSEKSNASLRSVEDNLSVDSVFMAESFKEGQRPPDESLNFRTTNNDLVNLSSAENDDSFNYVWVELIVDRYINTHPMLVLCILDKRMASLNTELNQKELEKIEDTVQRHLISERYSNSSLLVNPQSLLVNVDQRRKDLINNFSILLNEILTQIEEWFKTLQEIWIVYIYNPTTKSTPFVFLYNLQNFSMSSTSFESSHIVDDMETPIDVVDVSLAQSLASPSTSAVALITPSVSVNEESETKHDSALARGISFLSPKQLAVNTLHASSKIISWILPSFVSRRIHHVIDGIEHRFSNDSLVHSSASSALNSTNHSCSSITPEK